MTRGCREVAVGFLLAAFLCFPAKAQDADCFPRSIGDQSLGRYVVHETVTPDGDTIVTTSAAVAKSAYGGLIWCMYDDRPPDFGTASGVKATDRDGVVMWNEALVPIPAGLPKKVAPRKDFRACQRGVGDCEHESVTLEQGDVKVMERWSRRCENRYYVRRRLSMYAVGGSAKEREIKDQSVKYFSMPTYTTLYRSDGIEELDITSFGNDAFERVLVDEGEWTGGDCRGDRSS